MDIKSDALQLVKPLAGDCGHRWQDQDSPYLVAQICDICKLYRYKAAVIADWEYRAPIPRAALDLDWS